jgi:Fe-S cluster biogenesis protein NfuA
VERQGDFEVQEVIDDGAVKVNLIGECQFCIYKERIDQIANSK